MTNAEIAGAFVRTPFAAAKHRFGSKTNTLWVSYVTDDTHEEAVVPTNTVGLYSYTVVLAVARWSTHEGDPSGMLEYTVVEPKRSANNHTLHMGLLRDALQSNVFSGVSLRFAAEGSEKWAKWAISWYGEVRSVKWNVENLA